MNEGRRMKDEGRSIGEGVLSLSIVFYSLLYGLAYERLDLQGKSNMSMSWQSNKSLFPVIVGYHRLLLYNIIPR